MTDPLDPYATPSGLNRRAPRRLGRWMPVALALGGFGVVAATAGVVIKSMQNEQQERAADEPALPGDATALVGGLPLSGEIPAWRQEVRPVVARPPDPTPEPPPPPPPPPAPPPVLAGTAAPAKPKDDLLAAARRQEWQEYYRRADALKWKRHEEAQAALRSGLDTAWGAQQRQPAAQAPGSGTAADPATAAMLAAGRGGQGQGGEERARPGWFDQGPSDPARAWLAATVAPTIPRYALMKGDTIACRVTKNLGSEVGGQFTAEVRRPVTDAMGRTLIPQGATLVGSYDQNTGYAQERLPIGFTDVIFPPVGPDGRRDTLSLGSVPGSDAEGMAGFRDRVNKHTGRVLFSAVVSLLAGSAGAVAGQAAGPGIGGTLATAAGSGVGIAGRNTVGRGVNTSSTIEIRRGYDCSVELTQHVAFPGVWVDGVGHVPQ